MRFKANIQNIITFTRFTASLSSLGPFAWVRLDENDIRFTVIPEQGTQVWSVLQIDSVFESYLIESAADNVINLEVPLQGLHRALKSAVNATAASIRLTKRDGLPMLCLTINTTSVGNIAMQTADDSFAAMMDTEDGERGMNIDFTNNARERETIITQDIPIRVLSSNSVDGLHEPRTREPDVNIELPSLMQLKAISDRFTRLALVSKASASSVSGATSVGPRLELSANMHGCLRIRIDTDAMNINSTWTGLTNPRLDPSAIEGGEAALQNHPTEIMRQQGDAKGDSEEGWAKVFIDGRDWSKVMSVGRVGGRVIACFCNDHALILYVYMNTGNDDGSDRSVLTYYISSYSN
ncbi:Hus1-like protein [Microthyrium microscopicum]|uniref:Checkpoint protein n=1 Tax=Microthyrium microscopicum TaxID=703497 RepID=A0A6A6UKP9_9PEZI|nr:Hus1-like protein [Microthyrium microscopicum]